MEFLQALKLAKQQGLTNEEFREIWLKETDLKLKLNQPSSITSLTGNEKKNDKYEDVPAPTVEDSLNRILQQQEFILRELNHQGTELSNLQSNVHRGNSILHQSCEDYRNLEKDLKTSLEKEGRKQEELVRYVSDIVTSLKDVKVKVFHMVKEGLSTEGLILQERLSLTLESSINTIVEEIQIMTKSLNHVCLLSETSNKAMSDLVVTIKSELKKNLQDTVENVTKGVEQTLLQNLSKFESLPQNNTSPSNTERDPTKPSYSNTEKDFPKSSSFNSEKEFCTKPSFCIIEKDFPKSSPFNTERDHTKPSNTSQTPPSSNHPDGAQIIYCSCYAIDEFGVAHVLPDAKVFERDHTKPLPCVSEIDFIKSLPDEYIKSWLNNRFSYFKPGL